MKRKARRKSKSGKNTGPRKPLKRQYDVAVSFAGEDREYVERVAVHLSSAGVKVFYDKFEEAELWGKDLYQHLSDVYGKKAVVTVIFASNHYKKKLWTKRELQSAQAKALKSKQEYVLPAIFEESVTIPGIPKTTGYISLWDRTPEQMANLIISKLRSLGVEITARFLYSDEAKADVDFPRPKGDRVTEIVNKLKVHDWGVQAPAVRAVFGLDFSSLNKDQIFILGRNIYQCADGNEHTAIAVMNNLRDKLAELPPDAALHLLNGMWFEAYFNHEGEFRGTKLRRKFLAHLHALQKVNKFAPSMAFIRGELEPYRSHLPFVPDSTPETVTFELAFDKSDPLVLNHFRFRGHDLLVGRDEDEDYFPEQLPIAPKKFTIERMKELLSEKWSIPVDQIALKSAGGPFDWRAEYRLPKNHEIAWPEDGLEK